MLTTEIRPGRLMEFSFKDLVVLLANKDTMAVGFVILIGWWHYTTVKFHRQEINEWKAELAKERAAHDKTRERHEADAGTIQKLSENVALMNDRLIQLSFTDRGRA